MELILNGQREKFSDIRTLADLLQQKGVNPERVVIEYNKTVLQEEDLDQIELESGDQIEIISFVGGG